MACAFQELGSALRVSPIGRIADAAEVAHAMLFPACADSAYIVDHALVVDGEVMID